MYKPVIGLEIHTELKTASKMFCGCLNDADERNPNVNICPVCLGHPGTLPVINEDAIKKVIKTALSLNSRIPEFSKFDRKNYFYPDLPKGYQISQYDLPLSEGGNLIINERQIRIRRVHLEEDTGRLVHPPGADYSLVDFNRAGIPLMELVTEPDIDSAKEARQFAEELQLLLRYLRVTDADMEKSQMRIEANISLSPQSNSADTPQQLGTKVEVKNLNSFRSLERAIEYEIKRQAEVLDAGQRVVQETRGWDDGKSVTFSQRDKEEAHDYRYFPEPDLPVIHLGTEDFIKEIKLEIPELPQEKRQRLIREYQLDIQNAELFVRNKDLAEYFEKVISEFEPGLKPEKLASLIKLATNYLISDLQGLLAGVSVNDRSFLISAENFAEFISLMSEGKISSKIAKMMLEEMYRTGKDPSNIIDEKDLVQLNDIGDLEKIINNVIEGNPKVVQDYRQGKNNALQFLVGQVMAETKGKANPQFVNEVLTKTLTKTT